VRSRRVDIRLRHGKAISRTELIRSIIDAVVQSELDLSECDSAESITTALTSRKQHTSSKTPRGRSFS
jgi:hypothetical protein